MDLSVIDYDLPVSVDVMCYVYNHGEYLRQALDGMLMQETTFPVRIVIHDDASTDNSAEIIKEYTAAYPDRFVAVFEEENVYKFHNSTAWRKMFPLLTAKYTAYCEGDDYWTEKNKLQKQVDYLEANPDCFAVYHNILPVDRFSQYDESLRGCYVVLDEGDYSKKELKQFKLKTQTASLVRRNYNPLFSEEDKDFFCSVKCTGDAKNLILCGILGRVHYLPDVMAAHRRVTDGGDSWSADYARKTPQEIIMTRHGEYMEKCRFYEHFSRKKIYPYNQIITDRMQSFRESHKLGKADFEKVPFYAYIIYMPVFAGKSIRFVFKKVRGLISGE